MIRLAVAMQAVGAGCAAVGVLLLFGVGWFLLFTGAEVFGVGLVLEYGKPRGET